ncbi:MAG: class I SAM-dependent methyltransferase [Lentisphaerae bacterium]|nr:class I SAM-dependent methyltransferase [Lentisphaerota bacterium]
MNFVHAHRRGLILDCGAGRREACFENVVTLDVSADATTDVRGVAERLPFVNDCFDAVFSFAVLEHVKDPMRCAREMIRVLKPGHDYLGRPFVKCLADATRTELACCNTLIGVKPLEGERK